MYSNLFSPQSIAELTAAMQTQFPKAIWETFYVTLLSTALAVVIGLSLIATVILSKLIGCVLPLAAKKVHLDPAIMAAPLITTLVDTCSIIIYFSIATQVFHLN